MENLNYYVKQAFYIKLFEIVAITILLVASILLDLGLFLEYKDLKVLMREHEALELSNTREEKYLKEIGSYTSMYNFLDKEHIKLQLMSIEKIDYENITIDEGGIFITTNLKDIDNLDEFTRKLDDSGIKFDIKSITSQGKDINIEMKVS